MQLAVGEPGLNLADLREPFRQPAVEIRSGPPLDYTSISWTVAPAVATLPSTGTEARVVLSPSAARRLDECIGTFLITVLIFLLRRVGWHHVHAVTALDPQNRGWLVAGDARAGKSSTAALLASRGWPVGTDDTAFLRHDGRGVVAVGFRSPIALRRGGLSLIGRQVGEPDQRRKKQLCWPEELGGSWLPETKPNILLFTTVGSRTSTAGRLSAHESLVELVRWSAWVVVEPLLAQEHLELLNLLARQATGYRVTLGRDLFDNPERLGELIP